MSALTESEALSEGVIEGLFTLASALAVAGDVGPLGWTKSRDAWATWGRCSWLSRCRWALLIHNHSGKTFLAVTRSGPVHVLNSYRALVCHLYLRPLWITVTFRVHSSSLLKVMAKLCVSPALLPKKSEVARLGGALLPLVRLRTRFLSFSCSNVAIASQPLFLAHNAILCIKCKAKSMHPMDAVALFAFLDFLFYIMACLVCSVHCTNAGYYCLKRSSVRHTINNQMSWQTHKKLCDSFRWCGRRSWLCSSLAWGNLSSSNSGMWRWLVSTCRWTCQSGSQRLLRLCLSLREHLVDLDVDRCCHLPRQVLWQECSSESRKFCCEHHACEFLAALVLDHFAFGLF